MKDSELRKLVLQKYYEKRREDWVAIRPQDLSEEVPKSEVVRISQQLHEQGLIEFKPLRGDDQAVTGVGRITVRGIDLVERESETRLAEVGPVEIPSLELQHDLSAIRTLLLKAFTAKELWRFCQTRPNFEPILARIGSNPSLEDVIDVLTEFCRTRALFPELLSEIESYNPKHFEIYRSRALEDARAQDTNKETSPILDSTPHEPASKAEISTEQVYEARKHFSVQIISCDVSQEYGTSFPYSDYVRLRITNNSAITLPYLTVLIKRYDSGGKLIGSSRAPSIPTNNLGPGESAEYDYYPKGHLPGTVKLDVEIEQLIDEESMQFFKEFGDKESLQGVAAQAEESALFPRPGTKQQVVRILPNEYDFSRLKLSTASQTQPTTPRERGLQITIGVGPSGKLDLQQELRLVKAALLYADHTKLYSLTASMMQMIAKLGDSSLSQQIELFRRSVPYLASEDDAAELLGAFKQYQRLIRQRSVRNRKEQMLKSGFQRIVAQYSEDVKNKALELAEQAGVADIDIAVRSGLLEIHTFQGTDDDEAILQFTVDSVARVSGSPLWAMRAPERSVLDDEMVWEFVERVSSAVSDGFTYPLFDGQTSDLIQALVREKHIDVSDVDVQRGKHSGFAGHLLQRLPLFDQASVDEVLDIRQELEKPLTRFRGAIVEFSENIKSAPWDRDFYSDAEQVFYRDVGPAILDIEEAVKSNRLLAGMLRKFVDEPVVLLPGSIFSIVLSQFSSLPDEIALSLGAAVSSAAIVYDAYNEWKEKNKEIKANQLYFYYQAQQRLID